MTQRITLAQLAEMPFIKDYIEKAVTGSTEAERKERIAVIAAKRQAEEDMLAIEVEATEARRVLDDAQKAWETARGRCGAIGTKQSAAQARYQRAHKRLLDLGERTIEDLIRKLNVVREATESEITNCNGVIQRDKSLPVHMFSHRMKPAKKREIELRLQSSKSVLETITKALSRAEALRLAEISPAEIVAQVAELIETAGIDASNIYGITDRQTAPVEEVWV